MFMFYGSTGKIFTPLLFSRLLHFKDSVIYHSPMKFFRLAVLQLPDSIYCSEQVIENHLLLRGHLFLFHYHIPCPAPRGRRGLLLKV
mgnify:CR=1 FL=1